MNKTRIDRRKSRPKNSREILSSDIAIIGMACKFPGASDYNQFWQNISRGVDSIKVIPRTRWDINKYYSTDPRKQNTTLSKWGGLIDGERLFDNRFFNISPREAKNMDPQQRILLEETWHCIEDSAVPMKKLQKGATSCYVGVMASDYYQEAWASDIIVDSYAGLGNYDCILANRLSYFFGFTGVSMAVDAACASSLVAIHAARQSLMLGESDYAFAAGVNLTTQPWKYISFSKSRMLSPEGKCRTFDKDANGYVPGEGVGIILLQRLEDAIRENNHIYGLVIGSAVNHGGTTKSITAPAVGAQQDVITRALKDAGINPSSISYIEAHGTGTSLGDPVEIESLTKAFREYLPYEVSKKVYEEEILAKCPEDKKSFITGLFDDSTNKKTVRLLDDITEEQKDQLREILEKTGFLETRKNRVCKIGSVKTNIGHLEAAAGLAGVIKLVMMLKHKEVPPTLNVKTPNPIINFPKTPFEIAIKKSAWLPAKEGLPLRAGVSSFGFGGVNSHAIIEEYIPKKKELEKGDENKKLFVLSAKSPKSLNDLIAGWKKFSKTEAFEAESLDNICKTLLLGREDLTYRSGTIVDTKEDIIRFLGENDISVFNNKNNMWCLRLGNFLWNGSGQCSFLFKQGSLFADKLNRIFDECFDDEERELMRSEIKSASWSKSQVMRDLFHLLTGYVFISVLKECGLNYDVVSGEGNGFILAMVLSEMITLSDAVQILLQRKRWNRIKLNRPVIPFYDHVNKKTIMPFDFDDAYMALMVFEMGRKNKLFGQILVDGIFYTQNSKTSVDEKKHNQETQLGNILLGMGAITEEQLAETLEMQKDSADGDPLGELLVMNKYCKHKELKEALRQQDILRYFVNDVLAHYVKAAQMLFQPGQSTGQKTFENYLEEWNIILKKYGRDIKELLYDKHLFTAKKGRLRREKLLLMIILVSSFRRLNKKWNLTEEILIGEKRFYEIVDLVDDGVIPKESLVELFVSENPKYRDIAEICNSRQQFMKKNRPYTYVRKQNPNIREIIDVNEWVEASISSEDTVPSETLAFNPVQGYTFSQFGELSSLVECEYTINVGTTSTLEESFYESLLYLWLNGANLKWEKLIDENSFIKAVLPSYPFDRKPFWLERSRDLQKEMEEFVDTEPDVESKLIQLDQYG
ncbi:MAG: hypothetical protein JXJ04_18015, partial [Spirochaetales bacterium]|nr:hypothetical protein [Spirochaetales bacterium]